MRTAADEQLDRARGGVQQALDALGEVLIKKCWGHDEFKRDFVAQLQEAMPLLFQVQEKLTP